MKPNRQPEQTTMAHDPIEQRTREHERRAREHAPRTAGVRELARERTQWERPSTAVNRALGWEGGVA